MEDCNVNLAKSACYHDFDVRFSLIADLKEPIISVDFPFPINDDMSARMMAILGNMAAGQEVYSIDESFLDVTKIDKLIPFEAFGQQMRDRIRRGTGLITGVGIGADENASQTGQPCI